MRKKQKSKVLQNERNKEEEKRTVEVKLMMGFRDIAIFI